MKKLFLVLAMCGLSMSSMAQETTDPVQKYSVATNSFWSNCGATVPTSFR